MLEPSPIRDPRHQFPGGAGCGLAVRDSLHGPYTIAVGEELR
jgi:hypothetical protein